VHRESSRPPLAVRVLPLLASVLLLAPGARAGDRTRVVLLPMVVHSSDRGDYLQQGLSDMLVARFGRDRRLAVIEVEDPATATTDPDAARAAAKREGAGYVVFGSFTHFGEGASLDLQCLRVDAGDREPRRVFAQAPSLGALIPMLEDVSEKVTSYVDSGGAEEPAVASGPGAKDGAAASNGELAELRRRVEALERAVYDTGRKPVAEHSESQDDSPRTGPRRERR